MRERKEAERSPRLDRITLFAEELLRSNDYNRIISINRDVLLFFFLYYIRYIHIYVQ